MVLLLIGCQAAPTISPTAEPQPPTPPTLEPTPLPTDQPPLAVLLAVQELDAGLAQAYQALLQELADGSGMTVETRQGLQPGDIGPEWKVVLMPQAPANLAELTGAAPQVQFVTTDSSGELPAAANLTVIQRSAANEGFAAGYLATIATYDWRTGGAAALGPA